MIIKKNQTKISKASVQKNVPDESQVIEDAQNKDEELWFI